MKLNENITTDAQVGFDAAQLAQKAQTMTPESKPFVILQYDDYQKVESLEELLPSPLSKKGGTTLQTVTSFISFFKMHQNANTNIYANKETGLFRIIFDDNAKDATGWRNHTAKYSCPKSTEWDEWKACDKRKMSQADFAVFIERNLPDIAEPAAADMLEISRTLEAKKKVSFSSGIRLQDGQTQFTYNEEIDGATAKGEIKVPEKFAIGIPVFLGGDAYRVEAYLRYRIDNGNLNMWYELIRPHKVFDDAFNTVFEEIEKGTGLSIFCAEI